jgi:acyl carrier protein
MNRKEFIKNGLGAMMGISLLTAPSNLDLTTPKMDVGLVKKRVIKVLQEQMKGSKVKINWKNFNWDTNFTKDLGFDSLDVVEFIMSIEKEFSIAIPDALAEKMMTPKHLLSYLVKVV